MFRYIYSSHLTKTLFSTSWLSLFYTRTEASPPSADALICFPLKNRNPPFDVGGAKHFGIVPLIHKTKRRGREEEEEEEKEMCFARR